MKAVILAAGKGTRMRGLCASTPKPLVPIANRPVLSLTFSRLRQMGVDQVALVIGYQGDRLKEMIGDGNQYGVNVTYIEQTQQLGTGHATMLCEPFVGREPFVLIFGDIITREDNYAAMAELYQSGKCDAVLTVFPVEDPSNGAAVDVQDGFVRGIVEKPKPGTMLNAYNNAGMFIWPAEIFDLIRNLKPSPRGEYEFTDGIISFIKQGRRLAAFELKGYWENITDPETCIRMNQNVLEEFLPPTNTTTHHTAKIADRADVSECFIDSGAEVGSRAMLRGCIVARNAKIGSNVNAEYAEILDGAVIGDGCQLASNVSIGDGAYIEPHCRIGPNTSIGAGCVVGSGSTLSSTILLPGAKVGTGSNLMHAMVEAGAVLQAGSSFAGAPSKAIAVLKPE